LRSQGDRGLKKLRTRPEKYWWWPTWRQTQPANPKTCIKSVGNFGRLKRKWFNL